MKTKPNTLENSLTNSVVATFKTHSQAEEAVKQLQHSGFDMKLLSIVGKGYHTQENVVGYYNVGDRMLYWGTQGAFWGGFWGLLFGSGMFLVPGIGPVLVAGPFVAAIVGAVETAAVAGNESELPLFLSLVQSARFVGEIGLDFSIEGVKSKITQLQVFRRIAEALSENSRFVTLHTRASADDVVSVLEEHGVSPCVFHWYSGSSATLKRLIGLNHYCSINTAMLASKKGRGILEAVPKDRILTETDGPYVKVGKRAARPTDVRQIIDNIAEVWNAPADEVEAQVSDNFENLCQKLGITHEKHAQ